MEWTVLASNLLALAGTVVMTLGVLGIVRAEDINVRIHAGSLMAALGIPLMLLSLVPGSEPEVIFRALLVLAFVLLSTPPATQALAHLKHRQEHAGDGDG